MSGIAQKRKRDHGVLEAIEYRVDDKVMTGFLADGSRGSPAPGILVCHEAGGLDDRAKRCAESLADLGLVAFAMDMYGEPFSAEQALTRHEALMSTPGLMLKRASAALEWLRAHKNVDVSRVGVVGFCQGGAAALELARGGAPITVAVGFHPGFQKPAGTKPGRIAAKILMIIGNDDPVVPEEARRAFIEEMDASKADWQLHILGGVGHSFTNPAIDALAMPGFAYDPRAEQRAWSAMLQHLGECFQLPLQDPS